MEEPTFTCFPEDTLRFLADLKTNNDREWFNTNKTVYEQAYKAPAEAFCAAMTTRLDALGGCPHASKIFRIHRDVRFSKDKTPYNAHLHISFAPVGAGPNAPHWFFGLEPGSLVVGTGLFAFDKAGLEAYRTRVSGKDGDHLAKTIEALRKSGARGDAPELKRVPSGFDADHANADLLRRKGLAAWSDLGGDSRAVEGDLVSLALDHFARLKPLSDWLMAA